MFYFFDHFLARDHLAKDNVKVVEMRRGLGGDEELTSVCVLSAVSH